MALSRLTVVEWYRRRHSWRNSLADRRSAWRCWLASFVLHLALAIGLGSLLLPMSKLPPRPLLLSFASRPSEVEQTTHVVQLASVAVEPQETAADADDAQPQHVAPPVAESKFEVKLDPPNPAGPPAEKPAEAPAAAASNAPPEASVVEAGNQPPRLSSARSGANAPGRFRTASLSAVGAGKSAESERLAEDAEQQRMDVIVERFIRYDIGQLTGAAGQRARRDFEQLGSSAIPALVRGLNRSASIHASCPVCVITTKLQNSLSASHDRGLLQYAIANIGRGVPADAPHRGRLASLLKSLTASPSLLGERLASPNRSEQVAAIEQLLDQHAALKPEEKLRLSEPLTSMVEAADNQLALAAHRLMALMNPAILPPPAERLLQVDRLRAADLWREHWRRVEMSLELEDTGYANLAEALESDDLIERQAAALVIAAQTARLPDGQKPMLARRLIELLVAGDHDSQYAAQAALLRLAAPDRQVGGATAAQWRVYWDRFERGKLLLPRAASFLSMAKRFEARGQQEQAAERYRKIVTEFPDTPSAAEAAERLAQLTSSP